MDSYGTLIEALDGSNNMSEVRDGLIKFGICTKAAITMSTHHENFLLPSIVPFIKKMLPIT